MLNFEAELLQSDINALYTWCLNNNFTLNIKKCQVMAFTRARAVIKFDYYVNEEMLQRTMGPVKDLGILFDSNLKFDCHINNIVIRSNKMLGFIIRNCTDFSDKHTLRSIYCSLIRCICEYGSIIWSPYRISYKLKLEKI